MAVLIEYVRKTYPWLTVSLVVNTIIYSLLIAIIFKWLWTRRRMYKLSWELPGPLSLPFLGSVLSTGFCWPRNDNVKRLFTEHLKYASPFRIWFFTKFVVVLSDPDDIRSMIENNNMPFKPEMYHMWSQAIGNGLWTGHGGTIWKKHRLVLNPIFDVNSVKVFRTVIEKHCFSLGKTIGNETVDLKNLLEKYCGRVLLEILVGNIDLGEKQTDKLIHTTKLIRDLVNERMNKFWLHPNVIFERSKCHEETVRNRNTLEECMTYIFDVKKQDFFKNKNDNTSENVDNLLNVMIKSQIDGQYFSDREIIEELMNFYTTGIDSLVNVLTFFVLMLSINKQCQKKLQKEVDSEIQNDENIIFDMDKMVKFKYLNMCFKETLRMFPYGALLSKLAKKDVVLENKNIIIPSGTTIAIPNYFIQMNEKYWSEPESFRPERFSVDEIDKTRLQTFYAFGVGQRNCIGERLASYMIKSTVVFLVKHFDFDTDSNIKGENLHLESSVDNTVRLPQKCNITAIKRTNG